MAGALGAYLDAESHWRIRSTTNSRAAFLDDLSTLDALWREMELLLRGCGTPFETRELARIVEQLTAIFLRDENFGRDGVSMKRDASHRYPLLMRELRDSRDALRINAADLMEDVTHSGRSRQGP